MVFTLLAEEAEATTACSTIEEVYFTEFNYILHII